MSVLEKSLQQVELPLVRQVRQRFNRGWVEDIPTAVARALGQPGILDALAPGARVALGVGSRGIGHLDQIVRACVTEMKQREVQPFVVPAMGSHGGATAEGQAELLASYGITEQSVGAPVRASMDVVELGMSPGGIPVFFDRIAFEEADYVVPINRIKPHTDFRGPVESGLLKMIAIGFAKHRGAVSLHSFGMKEFTSIVPDVGGYLLEKVPIPFGLGIVENAYDKPWLIEAVPGSVLLRREAELLQLAWERMARLTFPEIDMLVVREMGKDISGTGLDPNVVGRYINNYMSGGPAVTRLVVLDLTEASHGNAAGMGLIDLVTRRLVNKIDFKATYTNVVTSTILAYARLPLTAESDQEAFLLGVRTLNRVAPGDARIAIIKNTLALEQLWISEPLWEEHRGRDDLDALSEPAPLEFGPEGELVL